MTPDWQPRKTAVAHSLLPNIAELSEFPDTSLTIEDFKLRPGSHRSAKVYQWPPPLSPIHEGVDAGRGIGWRGP